MKEYVIPAWVWWLMFTLILISLALTVGMVFF